MSASETSQPFADQYDCIVMGAGPAGSTVATLVATAGFRTLLVERDRFPRRHVGESLMPDSYFVFERLGMLEKLKGSATPEVGVQFVNHKAASRRHFCSAGTTPASAARRGMCHGRNSTR
jgi:2-polyprenyl-6-methoxyphenol hydroxylase-like FAD-dependent oxidoreductase